MMLTTINKKKKEEVEQKNFTENLFFHLDQDLTLTNKEVERIKKSLKSKEVDTITKEFFQSAHKMYDKLKKKQFYN
ncbi:MAG: hypothetical protein GF353_25895 [Candidatus Lokiarchaeota archaeon]|nr:hypothetical protein [Candidatus Lokiarchaeota archaeon]